MKKIIKENLSSLESQTYNASSNDVRKILDTTEVNSCFENFLNKYKYTKKERKL